MKNFFLPALLLISNFCYSQELLNFNQIKTALLSGNSIHINIDFLKCTGPSQKTFSTSYIGLFTPNQIMIGSDGTINTSFKFFTLDNPNFPRTPIYEYVTYSIKDNNSLQLTTEVLNAEHHPLTEMFSFTCEIGKGAKIYS